MDMRVGKPANVTVMDLPARARIRGTTLRHFAEHGFALGHDPGATRTGPAWCLIPAAA